MVDPSLVDMSPVRFADQVDTEVSQAGECLQHRIDEAIVGRIAQAHNTLLPGRIRVAVDEVGRGKDVYQRDGRQRCARRISSDGERLLWHGGRGWLGHRWDTATVGAYVVTAVSGGGCGCNGLQALRW